jgi:exosome complex RNA-binding protein Rrp42 (RNase PH superfamily)
MLNTCQAQRDLIRQSILHNIRIDGRKNSTKRTPIIKTDVIAHLPGSSYIYLEYENI